MSKFIVGFNQPFSQLEAMVEDARIPDSLRAPILLASFGTTSAVEFCIAALRIKDTIANWEELTADLILEASRVKEF